MSKLWKASLLGDLVCHLIELRSAVAVIIFQYFSFERQKHFIWSYVQLNRISTLSLFISARIFFIPCHTKAAGVLWVHICPSVFGLLVFLFQDDYLNEYQWISPNLVCALIL